MARKIRTKIEYPATPDGLPAFVARWNQRAASRELNDRRQLQEQHGTRPGVDINYIDADRPITERVPEYVLRYDDAGNVAGVDFA